MKNKICFAILSLLLLPFIGIAQTNSSQSITTAWGNYVNTNIGAIHNTILQVTFEGQNAWWHGTFTINSTNSWTPNSTWNNATLTSFSGYNATKDDVKALIMSDNTISEYGSTFIVLKIETPVSGTATITVVATGANASSLSLISGTSTPFLYTMASSVGTYNMATVNNNVGIGTISPGAMLQINAPDESIKPAISIRQSDAPNFGFDFAIDQTLNGNLFLNSTGVPNIMTFSRLTGNVGIGTTEPSLPLEVSAPVSNAQLRLGNGGTNSYYTYDIGRNGTDGAFYFYGNQSGFDSYVFSGIGGEKMRILNNGNILIGKSVPSNLAYKLDVAGIVRANKIVVNTTGADFVFDSTYKLPSLETVADFIKANKHLPQIASAEEMQKNGLDVGEQQTKLLQKIEELTLYAIEQDKKLKLLEEKLNKLLGEKK